MVQIQNQGYHWAIFYLTLIETCKYAFCGRNWISLFEHDVMPPSIACLKLL